MYTPVLKPIRNEKKYNYKMRSHLEARVGDVNLVIIQGIARKTNRHVRYHFVPSQDPRTASQAGGAYQRGVGSAHPDRLTEKWAKK